MFREPDEIAAEQAAAKLDQIAATRRSSIRRESTVRPHRQSPPERDATSRRSQREQNIHRFRALMSHRHVHVDLDGRDSVDDRASIETQIEHLRRERLERMRNRVHPDRFDPEFVEMMTRIRSHIEDSPTNDMGPDLTLEISSPRALDTVSQNLPRPSRESGLRFEVAASSQSESEQPRRPRFYSSRPTARRESIDRSPHRSRSPYMLPVQRVNVNDGADDVGSETASLTPGFAPAHGPFRNHAQPVDDRFSRTSDASALPSMPASPTPDTPVLDMMQQPPYPPLRRVSHLSPRPSGTPRPRVDGLGDRIRSPSPISDGHEEENWASLLTTIQPGRSSNATSFMSSRSDSQSDSNRSSQAATTATSFGEIGGDDTCDLDLPFGITEDDVRNIRARHGRLRPRDPFRSSMERMHQNLNRDLDRSEHQMHELTLFSNILVRMQRREEITDDMWAEVGLSPDVVRGSA